MHRRHAPKGQFDGHDLINWLDAHRNSELNDIYDLYSGCYGPEMTADQHIGKFLYRLGQVKIGERISPRRISRRQGYHRDGTCKVSIWQISPQTQGALQQSRARLLAGPLPADYTLADLLDIEEEVAE